MRRAGPADQNTNRIRNAIASPNRPAASPSAKPRKAKGCTWACAAGLRATALISDENTLPIPMPAPTSAMQARPAPIIFAEARSISKVPWAWKGEAKSVHVQRVAQIKAGQDREDIGLQRRDQDLERVNRDIESHRQQRQQADACREPAEDRQHRMAGQHVGEKPDRQRERPDEVRQDLD